MTAGKDAMFLNRADVAYFFSSRLFRYQLLYFGAKLGIAGDELGHDRVLGRELHRGRTKDRIDPRRKDRDLPGGRDINLEIHQVAFDSTNPVALHGADFFRPAWQLIESREQFLGDARASQDPLLHLPLLYVRFLS